MSVAVQTSPAVMAGAYGALGSGRQTVSISAENAPFHAGHHRHYHSSRLAGQDEAMMSRREEDGDTESSSPSPPGSKPGFSPHQQQDQQQQPHQQFYSHSAGGPARSSPAVVVNLPSHSQAAPSANLDVSTPSSTSSAKNAQPSRHNRHSGRSPSSHQPDSDPSSTSKGHGGILYRSHTGSGGGSSGGGDKGGDRRTGRQGNQASTLDEIVVETSSLASDLDTDESAASSPRGGRGGSGRRGSGGSGNSSSAYLRNCRSMTPSGFSGSTTGHTSPGHLPSPGGMSSSSSMADLQARMAEVRLAEAVRAAQRAQKGSGSGSGSAREGRRSERERRKNGSKQQRDGVDLLVLEVVRLKEANGQLESESMKLRDRVQRLEVEKRKLQSRLLAMQTAMQQLEREASIRSRTQSDISDAVAEGQHQSGKAWLRWGSSSGSSIAAVAAVAEEARVEKAAAAATIEKLVMENARLASQLNMQQAALESFKAVQKSAAAVAATTAPTATSSTTVPTLEVTKEGPPVVPATSTAAPVTAPITPSTSTPVKFRSDSAAVATQQSATSPSWSPAMASRSPSAYAALASVPADRSQTEGTIVELPTPTAQTRVAAPTASAASAAETSHGLSIHMESDGIQSGVSGAAPDAGAGASPSAAVPPQQPHMVHVAERLLPPPPPSFLPSQQPLQQPSQQPELCLSEPPCWDAAASTDDRLKQSLPVCSPVRPEGTIAEDKRKEAAVGGKGGVMRRAESYGGTASARVGLINAPLIGAPFRLVALIARYVAGADLVEQRQRQDEWV